MPPKKLSRKNSNGDAFLFIAFWLAVIIECVALFKREYHIYAYSRIWIVPILLVRLFRSQAYQKVNIYVWFSFFFALLADLMTIFGNYSISYIGLSLFSASYLSIGCFFHQLKTNHNNSYLVFILAAVLLLIVNILWLYAPELHYYIFFAQVIIHFLIIAYTLYGALTLSKKLSSKVIGLFLLVIFIIIVTNIVFGMDVVYFQRKHTMIDAFVGLGNAVYLFLFTRGILRYIKMNINSIG